MMGILNIDIGYPVFIMIGFIPMKAVYNSFLSAPGGYVFEVSAMNEDGIWNEQAVNTHFSISAHYTTTWWFRILIVLAIIGMSVLVAFGMFVLKGKNILFKQKCTSYVNKH